MSGKEWPCDELESCLGCAFYQEGICSEIRLSDTEVAGLLLTGLVEAVAETPRWMIEAVAAESPSFQLLLAMVEQWCELGVEGLSLAERHQRFRQWMGSKVAR